MTTTRTSPIASPPDSPAAAVRAMVERIRPVATELRPLERASGLHLGADAVTDRPSPASDVSAMDGYALRRADMQSVTALPIAGELPCWKLDHGMRISTEYP